MKILIVDDEPTVAQQLAASLEDAGVAECRSAESIDGARRVAAEWSPVDVLVTGIQVGCESVQALLGELAAASPEIRLACFVEPGAGQEVPEGIFAIEKRGSVEEMRAGVLRAITGLANDPLIGQDIGGYLITGLLRFDENGPVYRAMQTSISREVEFHALSAENVANPTWLRRFIADASVKANVRHPSVLAVYQAGREQGVYFYTSEISDRTPLSAWAEAGYKMDAATVLRVLHTVGEAMVHLEHTGVAHEPLTAEKILLDEAGHPRLVNLGASEPSEIAPAEELRNLANVLDAMLIRDSRSGPLLQLLEKLGGELTTWAALLVETRQRAPRSMAKDEHRLDEEGRATLQAKEEARRARRRRRVTGVTVVSVGVAALVLGGMVIGWRMFAAGEAATRDRLVKIPAGPFAFQNATQIELPDFWIDQHEVSIAQYAEFLDWVHMHPEEAAKLAHPGMPQGKNFIPDGWADVELPAGTMPGYYARARAGLPYRGAKLTLESPVFGIDWFDAYAYAKWKGRRLPSEQEWEKAAVGENGATLPSKDDAVNLAGGADGYEKWAPVTALKDDVSPHGVAGMFGNVAEWTASFVDDSQTMVVVRGGDWSNSDPDPRKRSNTLHVSERRPTVGFRTASDKAP